jgi:hypothetical protein
VPSKFSFIFSLKQIGFGDRLTASIQRGCTFFRLKLQCFFKFFKKKLFIYFLRPKLDIFMCEIVLASLHQCWKFDKGRVPFKS